MAVETEELLLKSNVAQVAARDAAALDKLLAAADKVNDATLSGNLDKQAQLAGVKAATAELQKQLGLEAKLASFDANRAKASADLARALKKANDDASGKTAENEAKAAARELTAEKKRQAAFDKVNAAASAKYHAENAKALAAEQKSADTLVKTFAAANKASAAAQAKKATADAKAYDAESKRLAKDSAAYDKHLAKMVIGDENAAKKKIAADANAIKTKKAGDEKAAKEKKDSDGKVNEGAQAGALALAKIAIAGAVIAASIALKIVNVAIDETTFRESSTRALDRLTKGNGSKAYDVAIDAAVKLGISKDDAVAQTKALLQAGLSEKQIPLAIKAIADVSVDLGAEKGNALKEQLGKINRKGVFNVESVNGLAEAGVKAADVYEALKKKGESTAQVMARLKTNQVDAAEGVAAVLAAIEKTSGGAADATKTIPGLLNGIAIRFAGLFDKIDTGPLKEVLKTVLELFEGAKGEKLKTSITELGDALFGLLKPLNTAEGKAAISDAFTKGAAAAHDLAIVVAAVGRGLDVVGKNHGFEVLALVVETLIGPLQTAADLIKVINGGSSGLGGPKADAKAAPVAASFDVAAANDNGAADVGGNMSKGVAAGIAANAGAVAASLSAVVNDAVKAAEAALGIASPSKRLAVTGKWTSLGMAKGMNDAAPAVADAGQGLADMASGNASGGGPASGGGAGAGAMPQVNINITIPAGPNAQATAGAVAEALGPVIRREIRAAQRDMAEGGGSLKSRVA